MSRPDRAVDHGLRLADQGACVPWDAMASIERAQSDAAARRLLATPGRHDGVGIRGRMHRWLSRGRSRSVR